MHKNQAFAYFAYFLAIIDIGRNTHFATQVMPSWKHLVFDGTRDYGCGMCNAIPHSPR